MNQQAVLDIFARHAALLDGHFELASGRHSNRYLQCALVLQHPAETEKLCRELAARFQGERIDVVVGPATGGIIIAYELARALGARGIFMERKDGPMALRRGFRVCAGERVLLAEDVMTTGGSVAEIVEQLAGTGGEIVGIACFIDRGGAARFNDVRVESLVAIDVPTYAPEDCPMCRQGLPVDKPGSQRLKGGAGKSAGAA